VTNQTAQIVRTILATYNTAQDIRSLSAQVERINGSTLTALDLLGLDGVKRIVDIGGIAYVTARPLPEAQRYARQSLLNAATDGGIAVWRVEAPKLWRRWVKADTAEARELVLIPARSIADAA
jgi:hypothetical protein